MPIELCHPYPFWLNTRISLSSFHAKKIKIKIYMYWHYQNTNRIEIDEWRSGRNIWFSKQLEHFCLVCMTSSSYIWKRISFSCLRQQTRNNTMPAWTTKINGKCIRRLWRQADIQLLSIYRNSVLVLIFSTDKLECYSKMLSDYLHKNLFQCRLSGSLLFSCEYVDCSWMESKLFMLISFQAFSIKR